MSGLISYLPEHRGMPDPSNRCSTACQKAYIRIAPYIYVLNEL